MKKTITTLLILIVLVMGGYFIYSDLKTPVDAGNGDVTVNTYNLTVNAENCTVTIKRGTDTIIAGENALQEDDTIIITAIADDGYEIETLLVNDIEIASGDSYVVVGNTIITATAVESDPGDVTVDTYNLTVNAENCTVQIKLLDADDEMIKYIEPGENVLTLGDKIHISVIPDDGYEFNALEINGTNIPVASITMETVGGNLTILATAVEFDPGDVTVDTYNLTVNTENCTVQIKLLDADDEMIKYIEPGENVLTLGDKIHISVMPDDGYEFNTLEINGTNIPVASITMETVGGNLTILATAVESEQIDPEPYAVQNGLKLVYDISGDSLDICLTGFDGVWNLYGYEYDWDIYLDNEFYDNYSGVTAKDNYITITDLNPGEHIICLEDKTGNDFCARSVNFYNSYNGTKVGIDLIEVYGYGNAYTGSSEMPDYCYYSHFRSCENLIIIPELPATTLADYCYNLMFSGCLSLTTAPELPATTLADFCYASMFSGCVNLTTTPALPATTLTDYCYSNMFQNCKNLIVVPELPATTLTYFCYRSMFNGCTNLTTAPVLPATTLADYCYNQMFQSCENLTVAPELPATILAESCYESMFQNCKNLIVVPELPATTLADFCYLSMFKGCTNLTTAPELLATILVNGCYRSMFYGCENLTVAPELPATTLAIGCYDQIFANCTKLTNVICYYPSNLESGFASEWLYGILTTGTLKSPDAVITYGLPVNWTAVSINESGQGDPEPYAVQNGLKLVYDVTDNGSYMDNSLTIDLSGLNGGWNVYGCEYDWDIYLDNEFYDNYSGVTAGNNYITIRDLDSGEHIVCMEDKTGNDYCARSFSFYSGNPRGINLTEVYGYGNAYNGSSVMPDYCYYRQFVNCVNLQIAPELPATILGIHCYESMFNGCTNLTTAPVLPATTLADYCYNQMFRSCENLTVAPELPATILAESCYESMFYGCESLTIAPELPATTLADNCYSFMFSNCKNLTTIICCYLSNLNSTFADGWLWFILTTGTLKSPNAVITYGLPDTWTAVAI